MEAIVFMILQIFFARRAALKIGVYSRISATFSWRIFGHVTCLDQSRASEKYLMDYNYRYLHPKMEILELTSVRGVHDFPVTHRPSAIFM